MSKNNVQQKPAKIKGLIQDQRNCLEYKKQTIKMYEYFLGMQTKLIIKELEVNGQIQRYKLQALIDLNNNILKNQPNLLKIISPIIIVGDIHGQFYDLLKIFRESGYPDSKKYLFLGDYIDRGQFCIQVMTLLLFLKLKHPKNIFLLRGNHQGKVMTSNFNFRIQCQKKYDIQIYQKFIDLFCKLPLCAVIDQAYFAVHGGISPELTRIKQLQKVNRFIDLPNGGVICDLVWSDPSQNISAEWESNLMRGCSYFYGKMQTRRFLNQNNLRMIIRGHEVQIEGFSYQKAANEQKLTLTIFSAPNYCDTYRNKGAIALINNNRVSIQKFQQSPHPFVFHNYMDLFQFSIPGVCDLVGKMLIILLKSRGKFKDKKASLSKQQIVQEINALQRLQLINQIIGLTVHQNRQVLRKQSEKQIEIETNNLTKSAKLAFDYFNQKKINDCQEMYPDEISLRMKKRKATLQKTINKNYYVVFGPKIEMKNAKQSKKQLYDQNQFGQNDEIDQST